MASAQLTHYFGRRHCRFLDPIPLCKYRITHDWLGNELKQSEIQLLKEIKAKLVEAGAIKNTVCATSQNEDQKNDTILNELERKNTKLRLAIVQMETH